MNTFEMTPNAVNSYKQDLGPVVWNSIKEELKEIIEHDNLCSVQLQTVELGGDGSEDYVTLYGVYEATVEEEHKYNSNGGLWMYSNPAELLAAMD